MQKPTSWELAALIIGLELEIKMLKSRQEKPKKELGSLNYQDLCTNKKTYRRWNKGDNCQEKLQVPAFSKMENMFCPQWELKQRSNRGF